MVKRIKTYLKFSKSEVNGSPVGYVTKNKGSWKGCRDTDRCRKKIVLVDKILSKRILADTLYQVTLVPMIEHDGFVAVSAEIVQFDATVTTHTERGNLKVEVRFGNKNFIYDPSSHDRTRSDIGIIIGNLSKRLDIKNMDSVLADFIDSAELVRRTYCDIYQPLR